MGIGGNLKVTTNCATIFADKTSLGAKYLQRRHMANLSYFNLIKIVDMKRIILVILISFGMNVKSQINFEQAYDSAGTYNFCLGKISQLVMVKFENSGERFVKINKCGKNMKIYDLNHNLLKTIDLTFLPNEGPPYYQTGPLLYLSEKLFNTDNKMEFMYIITSPTMSTNIYNEDGVLLFSEPGGPMVQINVHQLQYPIYNTSQGTKMILSYTTGIAKVFGLPGTLTTAIQKANTDLHDMNNFAISNPMPNPVSTHTQLSYVLPEGIKEGEIVLYDIQGKEVKRFKVDNTFDYLLISTSDMSAGTYYYQLQSSGQTSGAKKMIVIK